MDYLHFQIQSCSIKRKKRRRRSDKLPPQCVWIRLQVKEENRQEIDALVARQCSTVNSSVKSDFVTPLPSSSVITCAEEVMFSPVVSWFDSRIAQKNY